MSNSGYYIVVVPNTFQLNTMNSKEKVLLDTNIFIKLDKQKVAPNLILSKYEIFSANAQFMNWSQLLIQLEEIVGWHFMKTSYQLN